MYSPGGSHCSASSHSLENDLVIGIATSGRTSYVLGAVHKAHRHGATTIALTCNRPSPLGTEVDLEISPLVGAEVISGSTRLKAGAATKMILNGRTQWLLSSSIQDRRWHETAMSDMPHRHPVRLLGVDGGGTATEAWLAEPGCRVLGRGTAGPSNAKAVGLDAARRALDAAICAAFDNAGLAPVPVTMACLGLAGFDRPDDRKILAGWVNEACWADRLVLVNDGDLVVAAGTPEGWGVGVIGGTGSIAVGRASDGRTARAGGWGHLIGDEGSALWRRDRRLAPGGTPC